MIQSNKELYEKINKIIKELNFSNNKIFANKISNAMSISTIPSEILGESRLSLSELSKTDIPGKINIKNEVEESLAYLNKILS